MWPHTACGIETQKLLKLELCMMKVTCDLIPLAVLKREVRDFTSSWWHSFATTLGSHVTSYRLRYWNKKTRNWIDDVIDVTCDLIPLAVLKLRFFKWNPCHECMSHVTSYRLRYWNWKCYIQRHGIKKSHMWPHTACGIETRSIIWYLSLGLFSHMWPHTACGIETSEPCFS